MTDPVAPTRDPILDLLQKPEYSAIAQRVRQFMRDYEELHRLLEGYESNDRDILLAITLTIDDINATPPMIKKTIEQMVYDGWTPMIVLGAVLNLLRSVALIRIRNHLQFNDSGLMTGGLDDRWGAYMQWVSQNEARFENTKTRVKVAANLAAMMNITPSGVPSEFSLVHGLGRTWQ